MKKYLIQVIHDVGILQGLLHVFIWCMILKCTIISEMESSVSNKKTQMIKHAIQKTVEMKSKKYQMNKYL